MRFFIKLMLAAVVVAVLLPFTLLKGKDGRPLMTLDRLKAMDLEMPSLPKMKGKSKPDLIYRWTDAEGVNHYTNTPPPKGVRYTVKGYDPDANLIQSVKPERTKEPPATPVVKAPVTRPQERRSAGVGSPYSVQRLGKLRKDAENVQKLLEDRARRQEALIQGQ